MLNVQKYLIENGIQKLQDEFHIEVKDYPDRVTLNYSQIDSIKFHPITDECRGLILRKDANWTVISRAFNRFYNLGEGEAHKTIDISKCRIQEKIDGSIISFAWDSEKWNSATRKMAFGEGSTYTGTTFAELFERAVKNTKVREFVNRDNNNKDYTWIFEMASPESRVVTPYPTTFVALIGARHKESDNEMPSLCLDAIAEQMGVRRPKEYSCATIEQIENMAKSLPAMDEGFVIVQEQPSGSFIRIKCKNPKFVAIAHMRDNGGIPTAKNILKLVMENETAEYLQYFECDRPIFEFVSIIYNEVIGNINTLWDETKDIKDQKEFALTVIPRVKYKFESGVLFSARKNNTTIAQELAKVDNKKLSNALGLKEKVAKQFGIMAEEDDEK